MSADNLSGVLVADNAKTARNLADLAAADMSPEATLAIIGLAQVYATLAVRDQLAILAELYCAALPPSRRQPGEGTR